MSTTAARMGLLTDQSHMIAAINEAAALEGGKVLTEHYSFQEYINRRSQYLASHYSYRTHTSGFFPIARRDAVDIFGKESEQLSVQEIRRREIRLELVPLLPLPTTTNTDSIDSFRSYPASEWSPTMAYPPLQVPANMITGHINGFPKPVPTGVSHQQKDIDLTDAPTFAMQLAQSNAKAMASSVTQPANLTKATMPYQQTTAHDLSDMPSSTPASQSTTFRRMSDQPSTQATSPLLPEDSYKDTTHSMVQFPQSGADNQDLIHQILAALGSGPGAPSPAAHPMEQLNVAIPEGISALKARGIPSVVKAKQGTKRAIDATSDIATESVASGVFTKRAEATPPAQKKLKITVRKHPESLPTKAEKGSRPKQAMKTPAAKSKTNMERIIAGTALPQSSEEAKAAATTRHTRLLAQHQTTKKSRAERARKSNKNPDLLPESFSTAKFPVGREHDQVRCVCRLVEDDGQDMIACDKCMVWQHTICMGAAVPEDTESEGYLCQMCDPYAHRELVAKLRREHPLME